MAKNKFLPYLALTLLTIVSYLPCFTSEFLGDDFVRIVDVYEQREAGALSFIKETMPDRPLLMLSIYLNYFLSDANSWSFKAVNIFAHLLVGIWFYLVIGILFKKMPTLSRFVMAALFCVHPLATQPVNIVIQRGVVFSALLMLMSFYYFLIATEKAKCKKAALFYSWAFFLLAVLFKPNVFVYPIFLILFCKWTDRVKYLRLCGLFFLPLIYPIISYKFFGHNHQDEFATRLSSIDYFGVQLRAWWLYFKLMIIPWPLRYFTEFNFPKNLDFPYHWALLHGLLFGLGLYFLRKFKLAQLFFISLYLFLLPESSFFSINDTYFDHRAYLPLLFFCLLLTALIAHLHRRWISVFILIVVVFSTLTHLRLNQTATVLAHQEEIYREHPDQHLQNMQFLINLVLSLNVSRGRQVIKEVRAIDPDNFDYKLMEDIFYFSDFPKEKKISILEKIANIVLDQNRYQIKKRMRVMLTEFVAINLKGMVDEQTYVKKMEALFAPQEKLIKRQIQVMRQLYYSPATRPSPRGSETP